jgi:dienelactone hydrolase
MSITRAILALLLAFHASISVAFAADDVPQTVEATWADFDPRAEPLEVELVRESIDDGVVLRSVRYVVGTFRGKKTKVVAFYAFPEGAKGLPAIVQMHGGGQAARKNFAQFWAQRGYAAIAVNWGENVIDQPDDPNTDWAGIPAGFIEPKHHNGVEPAAGTQHAVPHPWNSSWLLYSAAARRAITFLEEQPEADGDRVGLQGHSMGGRLTVLTAIDSRIKAASPSVGGSGYLYQDIAGIPGSSRHMLPGPARDLYLQTLDCREYWPLIKCPVMFLGATNDFNSPMEFALEGFLTLPNLEQSGMSFTPHMNHRFTVDNYAARVRWFDTHLKRNFTFPKTATAELQLKTANGIPRITIRPDLSGQALEKVVVYYGYDRDPRARFWRSVKAVRDGDTFSADCPVVELGEPLFAFANVTYETNDTIRMPAGYHDNSLLTVTSECCRAYPQELARAGVKPTGERRRLIDDFSNGWQDWSLVGVRHRAHWNYETHKINDPAFVGPRGASLAFEIETDGKDETLAVVLYTDQWRSYSGRKSFRYTALVNLAEPKKHAISLPMEQFLAEDGHPLNNYDFVTSLILTPGQKERPEQVSKPWSGNVPTFHNLRWDGGEFKQRLPPYPADATF